MRLNYFARSVLFAAHSFITLCCWCWLSANRRYIFRIRFPFSSKWIFAVPQTKARTACSAEPPRRTNRIEIETGCRIWHELLNNLHSKWFNWTTVAIKLDMKINRQFPVGCTPRMGSEMEMKRLDDEWTRMRRHWERQINMIDCLSCIFEAIRY